MRYFPRILQGRNELDQHCQPDGLHHTRSRFAAGRAVGQERSLREQLVGTWLQVSIDGTFPDGTKRQLFGPNPKGILIYTSDGYFSLMQSRVDLPKLEFSNRATATAEEAKAVVAGSIAYFGKYTVNEASKVVSIDIQVRNPRHCGQDSDASRTAFR